MSCALLPASGHDIGSKLCNIYVAVFCVLDQSH